MTIRFAGLVHESQHVRLIVDAPNTWAVRLPDVEEPTTALDVTVQAQILDLLIDLQPRNGMDIMLISRDVGVIAESCQEVAVMYRKRRVERASAEKLFADTRHPYTRGLMRSIPNPDHAFETLDVIPGRVPDITDKVSLCIHPRRQSVQACHRAYSPPLQITGKHHESLCHFTSTLS